MISRGVAFMLLSAAGFSAMSALVKLAGRGLPVGEVVLARALVTLLLSWLAVRRLEEPWGRQRGRLVLRGVLGFGGLTCYYLALSRLPIAEATTLYFTTPVLTSIFAWRMLGERVRWHTAAALALGFGGVIVISQPGRLLHGAGLDPVGVAAALTAAVFSALAYVTVRSMAQREHSEVIVFYFPLVATPLAVPWAATAFVIPSLAQAALLVGVGVATQIGQVFLTKSLVLERAAIVTTVGYAQVGFAMAWGLLFFHDGLRPSTAAGVLLIGLAVAIIGIGNQHRGPAG
jgi:drug/metabolite transporter (DMT)-like permease